MTDLITDAKMLSGHARKKNIDVDDVRLSACQLEERHVSCPPARHVISQLARTKNSVALPAPANKHGTRLPSDRFCLTGVNYRYCCFFCTVFMKMCSEYHEAHVSCVSYFRLKSKKPKVVNNTRRPTSHKSLLPTGPTETGEDLDLDLNGSNWSENDPPVFTIHYQREDNIFTLPQSM